LREHLITIAVDIYVDGGATSSERMVLSHVMLGVDENWPETGDVSQTASGGYRKKYVFSGASPAAEA
jgi:hypothetical protein